MDNYELVAVKVKNSVTYDRTFCQTPVEGNNKCLHTEVKISRLLTNIYIVIR